MRTSGAATLMISRSSVATDSTCRRAGPSLTTATRMSRAATGVATQTITATQARAVLPIGFIVFVLSRCLFRWRHPECRHRESRPATVWFRSAFLGVVPAAIMLFCTKAAGKGAWMCATSRGGPRPGATLRCMANHPLPGEEPGQIEGLIDRWQVSLDLHAHYAALDDARYWHVQPWPKHERPQRWIIQLARKRILALKRIVTQRQAEGDRAFIEGIETMAFLATLVGLTSVERYIPLATRETERREVLSAKPEKLEAAAAPEAPRARPAPAAREPAARTGEHKRTAETTRQMPVLPNSRAERLLAAQRVGAAPRQAAAHAPPRREVRRDAPRPAT